MSNPSNITAQQAVRFPYINHSWDMTLNIVKGNHSKDPQIATAQKVALYSGVGLVVIAMIEAFKNFAILIANTALVIANAADRAFCKREIELLDTQASPVSIELQPSAPELVSSSSTAQSEEDVLFFPDPEVAEVIPQMTAPSAPAQELVVETQPLPSAPAQELVIEEQPVLSSEKIVVSKQIREEVAAIADKAKEMIEEEREIVTSVIGKADTVLHQDVKAVKETVIPVIEKVIEKVEEKAEELVKTVDNEIVISASMVLAETSQANVEEAPVSTATVNADAPSVDAEKKAEPTVVVEDDKGSGVSDLEKETPVAVTKPSDGKSEATPDTKLEIEVDEPAIAAKTAVAAKSRCCVRTGQAVAAASVLTLIGVGIAYGTGNLAPMANYVSQISVVSSAMSFARSYGMPI